MIVGAVGMAAYSSRETSITTDEKISILLGFVMVLFGFFVIYGDRKKKKHTDHEADRKG